MYGCNDQEYYEATGSNDGYRRLKEAVKILNDKNVMYYLSVVVTNDMTEARLNRIIDTAIEIGANNIKFGGLERFGRAKDNYDKINEEQIASIFSSVLPQLKKRFMGQINISLRNERHEISEDQEDEKREILETLYSRALICGGGTSEWVISENGIIRQCLSLPEQHFSIGEVGDIERLVQLEDLRSIFYDAAYKYASVEYGCSACDMPCRALERIVRDYERKKTMDSH